jgi:hypothetical protein
MAIEKFTAGHLAQNGRISMPMTDARKVSLSRAARKRNAYETLPKVGGLGWATKQSKGE